MLTRFLFVPAFILVVCSCTAVTAQQGGLGQTIKNNAAGAIQTVFAKYKSGTKTSTPARPKTGPTSKNISKVRTADPIKFMVSGPSGVSKMLADALGRDATEKKNLNDAFDQLLSIYNAEVRKENKANDLAAALTFFIGSNIATYKGEEPMDDAAAEKFYDSIAVNMRDDPAIVAMSAAEKHQVHDWLAIMAMFINATYQDAKSKGDDNGVAVARELAAQVTKLVLGIDISELPADLGNQGAAEQRSHAASKLG
jgi:hypothetical protein